MTRRFLLSGALASAVVAWRGFRSADAGTAAKQTFEVTHTEEEWRKLLAPERFRILRKEGTEPPFSSPLNAEKRAGTFACAGCSLPLFSSKTKFDSRTGWPSFWAPLDHAIGTTSDRTLGMVRTEVHCRRCGGHQGHVFDDGPKPTGLRYCINGLSLIFHPDAAGA